jgi:hypothetical protein
MITLQLIVVLIHHKSTLNVVHYNQLILKGVIDQLIIKTRWYLGCQTLIKGWVTMLFLL